MQTKTTADVGDYMKVFACTAVIMQSVLAFGLQTSPSPRVQTGIGITYNLVKYTAPAFIFGILFTTVRTHERAHLGDYRQYLTQQLHSLFIPTFWWSLVYLLGLPSLQQVNHYHNFGSFIWQFINGNAAPHLWYNTMMLQFILLMPFFWWLARWAVQSRRRLWGTLLLTIVGYGGWLAFYDQQVFNGPHHWYLLDRLFVSFLIYGIFGALAWKKRRPLETFLQRYWPLLIGLFGVTFIWTNLELRAFGQPVRLTNAIYYKPSMTLYALVVIGLVATLAWTNIRHQSRWLPVMHGLATYAYRAYLANVFWLQLLWLAFGHRLSQTHPVWATISCYGLTWLLSFASAYGLHVGWSALKRWA